MLRLCTAGKVNPTVQILAVLCSFVDLNRYYFVGAGVDERHIAPSTVALEAESIDLWLGLAIVTLPQIHFETSSIYRNND